MTETNEEIAKRYDALVAEGRELENLTPVKARVKAPVDTVYSTRFTRDEIDSIRKAARDQSLTASAFIRSAALAAATRGLDVASAEQAAKLQAIRTKARELSEAVSQL